MKSGIVALTTLALLAGAVTLVRQADAGNTAQVNYMLHCMGCHLEDGAGAPGKVPALKDQMGKFLHVPGGRRYLVQVPGVAQAALPDQDLAAVLNWTLETFSSAQLPADFAPYSSAEVARYRRHKLIDVAGTRAALVAAMPEELRLP